MPDVADHEGMRGFSVDDAVGSGDGAAMFPERALQGCPELGVAGERLDALP
jgi:hypothetical protein